MPRTTLIAFSLTAAVAAGPLFAFESRGALSAGHDAPAAAVETAEAAPMPFDLSEMADSDPSLAIRPGENGEADTMMMLSDVLFGFGDSRLNPAAIAVLQGLVPELENAPMIEITGHTDAIGDEDSNAALGLRRANAVRWWLIENSALTTTTVTAVGIGETDPVADNVLADGSDNPEGRAQNRRVEFTFPTVETVELASAE